MKMVTKERQSEPEYLPIIDTQLGEWFYPFSNYARQPYLYNIDRLSAKTFLFRVKGIGRFIAGVHWYQQFVLRRNKGIIILPFDEQIIHKKEDLPRYEEETKSRLFAIVVGCKRKYRLDKFRVPYQVEIRSPNGKVFVSLFEKETELAGLESWEENEGKGNMLLLIPEVENTLDKIQMRIVSKEN